MESRQKAKGRRQEAKEGKQIKSIAVERFENNTAEYGLEDRMTDQIIDALNRAGRNQ